MKKRIVQALSAALGISLVVALSLVELPKKKQPDFNQLCRQQGEKIIWFIKRTPEGLSKQRIKICPVALKLAKLGIRREGLEDFEVVKICGTLKQARQRCPEMFALNTLCGKCNHRVRGDFICRKGKTTVEGEEVDCNPRANTANITCTPIQCNCPYGQCSDEQNMLDSNEDYEEIDIEEELDLDGGQLD